MTKEYIYALIDPRTDQIKYIGRSTKPKARLTEHLGDSKIKYSKKDLWIQELMKEGFIPELMIVDEFYNDVAFWEVFYIQLFKSWGYELTNEVCDIQKRKDSTFQRKGLNIIVLDTYNNFVGEYFSIQEAATKLNVNHKKIQEVLAGKKYEGYGIIKSAYSYKGYVYIRKEEYDSTKDYTVKRREHVQGKIGRVVQQYDKDNNLLNEYRSCLEAFRQTGIDNASISKVCDNKPSYIQAGGYIWKYRTL